MTIQAVLIRPMTIVLLNKQEMTLEEGTPVVVDVAQQIAFGRGVHFDIDTECYETIH